MPRPAHYPLTPEQLEAAIASLITTGKHLDGKSAVEPKRAYFLNFCFHSSVLSDGIDAVRSPTAKISMRCQVHDEVFPTSARILFNTSKKRVGRTCRFCEREAGVGADFVTVGELAMQMHASDRFDWTLDPLESAEDRGGPRRILKYATELSLLCKRNRWNSNEGCRAEVRHTLSNIQSALRRKPGHVVCQGACDSTGKGKANRKSRKEFLRLLEERRGGRWTLSHIDAYRKIKEAQWFTHRRCGHEVWRIPDQILNYLPQVGVPATDTDDDCPYCTGRSALSCLNGSVPHFSRWVDHVTGSRVQYTGADFPHTEEDFLAFKCACGADFTERPVNFRRYEHLGCGQCKEVKSHAPRAWVLADATSLVQARGYTLADDPGSYTAIASLCMAGGEAARYDSVLALLQAIPAHAKGFGEALLEKTIPAGRSDAMRACRVHVNDEAFMTLSPEACYWAGLLAADATITDSDEVILELKAIDEGVMQQFARFAQFTGAFRYRTVAIVDGRGVYCALQFKSPGICADLRRHFGIGPRKTRTLPRPNIEDPRLAHAYMVGLLEGDGHVRATKRGLVVHFVSAAPACFEWFLEQAQAITLTSAAAHSVARPNGPIYNVTFGDAAALRLLAVLQKAFSGTMVRKWGVVKSG